MATINGSGAAVQNRETIRFTPNQSGEYGGRYEGPKAAVMAKMNELIAQGWACSYNCDASPVATLEFSTPTNSKDPSTPPTDPNLDYTDSFQVMRNTVQKELLASDHPLVAELNATNLEELKEYIAKPETYYENDGFTLTGADSFDAAVYLFDLWRAGVKSIEVKQPVLRVTRITNPIYDAPFDVSNVDSILTTSTMLGDSNVPSNFAIPLLQLANRFIRSTTTGNNNKTVRTDSLILHFGWLKDSITSETSGTTRIQYVVEYKFGLWDAEIHGVPI